MFLGNVEPDAVALAEFTIFYLLAENGANLMVIGNRAATHPALWIENPARRIHDTEGRLFTVIGQSIVHI